ncbi:MAG: hypothetical protein K6C97_09030 [Treponema sp.]|nr:hypothetical protein [Treponema sp.]
MSDNANEFYMSGSIYIPASYTEVQVLTSDTSSYIRNSCTKFKVTNPSDNTGKNWVINPSGYLKNVIGTKLTFVLNDIVFNDGSTAPYSSDLVLTDTQKNAAIAVIFMYKSGYYYGVGLKETTARWMNESSLLGYENLTTNSTDDGKSNTEVSSTQTGSNNTNFYDYPFEGSSEKTPNKAGSRHYVRAIHQFSE